MSWFWKKKEIVEQKLEETNNCSNMKYQELINKAYKDYMPWKAHIILCAKKYIEIRDIVRSNPLGFSSCHGPKSDPRWAEYYKQSKRYSKAYADLLLACDVEYGDDAIANAAWEWKYWKVMARKCCWSQRFGSTQWAGETMSKLQDAETNLMKVCGLLELYRPSCYYLEKAFSKLKMKK
jgi:hypothetical protein